ncbi:hypothetical protein TrRE_jg176, partial [Triparma retinervis]
MDHSYSSNDLLPNSQIPIALHLRSDSHGPSFTPATPDSSVVAGESLDSRNWIDTHDFTNNRSLGTPDAPQDSLDVEVDASSFTGRLKVSHLKFHSDRLASQSLARAVVGGDRGTGLRKAHGLTTAAEGVLGRGDVGRRNLLTTSKSVPELLRSDATLSLLSRNHSPHLEPPPQSKTSTTTVPFSSTDMVPSKPMLQAKKITPFMRTSSIYHPKVFTNSEKHKGLLYPTWLAVANASRTLRSDLSLGVQLGHSIVSVGEKAQAAVTVQRSWRGFIERAKTWRFGGEGTNWAARKIQRRWRGMIGRRKAAVRWQERDTEKANYMIALYWGMKGRKIARENRTAIWYNATSMIQRNYRGRLGKKIFAIHRERVKNRKAAFLQRCWRGYRGRWWAWRHRKNLDEGALKMRSVVSLHESGELWASIFDKDGDGEEDDDAMPDEDDLLEAALCLMCVSGDLENARLYIRDALRFYPESPKALLSYAILLHLVWDCYGFLKVPRPDILDEALEIVLKAWELDPERTSYTDLEVAYFQNARRMRPNDPKKLCNQAVMLHVVYGSFDPKELTKKRLQTYWDSNRRAENLFTRAIDLDYSCQHPQIRSIAKVYRSLYKSPRVLASTRAKAYPIGEGGKKVLFDIQVFKCVDRDGPEIDQRMKLVCAAQERPEKKKNGIASEEGEGQGRGGGGGGRGGREGAEDKKEEAGRKLSVFKAAAKGQMVANAMKVERLENVFEIKETRKKGIAETTKNQSHADLERYRAHLRVLNLKVNPVSREFVIHEAEWRSMLEAAAEMEKRDGRPAVAVDIDAKKDPMKMVAGFVSSRLCIKSIYDTIENERQRVLVLPQIQGLRDRAVKEMIEEYAARRLQRIFRGFQGRAQMKRMLFRVREKEKQAGRLTFKRKKMAERREYRAFCACLVQARFKGIVWRRRLAKMQGASVIIQTVYRGFATRSKMREAQRKMLEGAKVDTVYRRGMVVSGCHLFLSVKRCGLSWKFIGRSEHHMDTFYGYVYREQTLEVLEEHNRRCKLEKERLKEEHERQMRIKYEGWDESKESTEQQDIKMMQDVMKGTKKDEDPNAEVK